MTQKLSRREVGKMALAGALGGTLRVRPSQVPLSCVRNLPESSWVPRLP